jgi:hypothetical protein
MGLRSLPVALAALTRVLVSIMWTSSMPLMGPGALLSLVPVACGSQLHLYPVLVLHFLLAELLHAAHHRTMLLTYSMQPADLGALLL